MVFITGVIGSGKSTLLRAILGEVPIGDGTISIATGCISYCSQKPWLPHGTIKEIICGLSTTEFDPEWYRTVLDACALGLDISTLSRGDSTLVGSSGVALSGGQKQRVALARALYSRSRIFLLDDIFSSLDKRTEGILTDRLLGKWGLFQKLGSTVILVTHASMFIIF
jgi:ABC-type bacteriocin/lantibiotic exporter with double-glycine peptidase domain